MHPYRMPEGMYGPRLDGGMKMSRWIGVVSCCVLGSALQTAALAQDRIYRCGNEYTNSASIAKQRNCQLVDGGHVTVVHSGSKSAGNENKSNSAAGAPRSTAQVESSQQKARDNDARAILQGELAKAQEKLQALKNEYNEGNPTKTALELRNPQVFTERLEAMKAQITRQEADVAGIQRELARHSGS